MPAGTCRKCGCTETTPCRLITPVRELRCSWVEPDLCSACTPSQRGIGWEHPIDQFLDAPGGHPEGTATLSREGRTAGQLLRDCLEHLLPSSWVDRLWPVDDSEWEWDTLDLPFPTTEEAAIAAGRYWLDAHALWRAPWEGVRVVYKDVAGEDQVLEVEPLKPQRCRSALLPVGGIWDGPASTENATETEDPMEAGLDAGGETPEMREARNERERDAERSAPHRESTQERLVRTGDDGDAVLRARDRIDRAEEIPHTAEQAERAGAGESKAVTALRRLVGFLLTTNRASLAYNGDIRAMVVVDAVRTSGATFDPGDVLIDYDECEAIKDLLERAAGDESPARIENVALRAEVDRWRRYREEGLKIIEDLRESLTARDRSIDRLGARLETMQGEVRTLLHHLDGSDGMPAAWWLEAGRAAARLQGMVEPQGSDSPQPPTRGAGSLRPVPGRRGGRVH